MIKKILILSYSFITMIYMTACSSPNITNTKRSAVEQLLLCAAIEQGISKADFSLYSNKVVKMDYTNLDPQVDKHLIVFYTESHLRNYGVIISTDNKPDPEFIIKVGCGVLATDIDKSLIGSPPLPIPIPDTSVSVVIPEIPIYRRISRTAYGRFYFSIIDAKSLKAVDKFKSYNSKTQFIDWTILMIPFKSHNVPLKDIDKPKHEFIFIE